MVVERPKLLKQWVGRLHLRHVDDQRSHSLEQTPVGAKNPTEMSEG